MKLYFCFSLPGCSGTLITHINYYLRWMCIYWLHKHKMQKARQFTLFPPYGFENKHLLVLSIPVCCIQNLNQKVSLAVLSLTL